jgi:hypothetical protein
MNLLSDWVTCSDKVECQDGKCVDVHCPKPLCSLALSGCLGLGLPANTSSLGGAITVKGLSLFGFCPGCQDPLCALRLHRPGKHWINRLRGLPVETLVLSDSVLGSGQLRIAFVVNLLLVWAVFRFHHQGTPRLLWERTMSLKRRAS